MSALCQSGAHNCSLTRRVEQGASSGCFREERLSEPLPWRGADDTPRQDSHSTVYLYQIDTWPRRNCNSNVKFTLNACTHRLKIDVVSARMFLY
jgi:hypothetical protein